MKITKPHTSAIDIVQKLLKHLKSRQDSGLVSINKISLGVIISRRSSTNRNLKLKMAATKTCLEVTATQNSTVQRIRIYSNNAESVITSIKDFDKSGNLQIVIANN